METTEKGSSPRRCRRRTKKVRRGPLPSEDFDTYLKTFPRLPLLTNKQEKEYGRVLRAVDEETTTEEKQKARDALILHNIRLVVAQAVSYSRRSAQPISVMDLVSEGLFGLFDAARRYSPERDCRFSTYATWWIRRYIRKAVTGNRSVRIPYYMNGILSRHPWAVCSLVARLGRDPTVEEIAEDMEIRVSELVRTLSVASATKVFNPTIESPEGSTIDCVTDDRDHDGLSKFMENKRVVRKVLSRMPPDQATLLKLRFGISEDDGEVGRTTFKKIGQIMKLSKEKVRALERTAMSTFVVEFGKVTSEEEGTGNVVC